MTGSAPSSNKPRERVADIAFPAARTRCEYPRAVMQELRDDVVILGEELVVDVHELALADGGGRLLGRHVGRLGRAGLSLPTPMPMAPEETRMISCPAFFRSLSTLHSRSMR